MITHIEKFGASWCGPCKVLDKTLEKVTGVDIQKYDVDQFEDLAEERGVRNVPVLIFWNGDKEVDRLVGAVPLSTINEVIEKWKLL
jgi:thioredoxin-like negative regulator of GroEL